MSFFTYILECSDGKYYTGFTDDLDSRVVSHNTGEYPNAYTIRRRPVKLVFFVEFEDAESARESEPRRQNLSGFRFGQRGPVYHEKTAGSGRPARDLFRFVGLHS